MSSEFFYLVIFQVVAFYIKSIAFLPHSRRNGLFVVTQKVLLGINNEPGFSHFTLIWCTDECYESEPLLSFYINLRCGWYNWWIPLKEMLLPMDGLSGMIGLFSLCSAQDRVVRPQNHITPSAPGGMIEALQIKPHCIVSCWGYLNTVKNRKSICHVYFPKYRDNLKPFMIISLLDVE